MTSTTCVYIGEELAAYHFGHNHPFGPQRHQAFVEQFHQLALDKKVCILPPRKGSDEQILQFHTPEYLARVKQLSRLGVGYLDQCDTPATAGIYEAALNVVGTTLDGIDRIMQGQCRRVFTPIGGLHHAQRNTAAGFCVFNDCGIAIEVLRKKYHINKIAYVDIDAHHGDGVFYSFEDDPDLCFVDIREDGRTLYPGTGSKEETGRGRAYATKLNIPMPMHADDNMFRQVWYEAEKFIENAAPEFILFQCGADSLAGDPITHMHYSCTTHAYAATRLCHLAEQYAQGRILAMGGGGYNLTNLAVAWNAVVQALVETDYNGDITA